MRSGALGPQPIENGNAESPDQIPVRAAAGRLFLELEAQLAAVVAGSFEELGRAVGTLERRAGPAAAELQLRLGVNGTEAGEFLLEPVAVGHGRNADVDPRLGLRGDDVLRGSAADDPDVDGGARVVVGQRVQREDLVRELLDRADAVGSGRSGV